MKNYLFYITIFFLGSILLIFFLIFPNYQNLTFLKKEISEKEVEFSSQEKYFQDLQNIAQELKKHETDISKIDSALPTGLSLPELLNFIQMKASQSGLALKGVSPATIIPAGEKGLNEIRVNFILIGNYSDFKNFLSILEKSARLIEIENISFSSPEEGPFTFNLTIKVYSY
jgi:Tfp pilus assembly protein PilO